MYDPYRNQDIRDFIRDKKQPWVVHIGTVVVIFAKENTTCISKVINVFKTVLRFLAVSFRAEIQYKFDGKFEKV